MDFVTAEEKFSELQARIRRGEPMSEEQYQEELAKLMVQDDSGVFWSLEPGTGRWLYFNGTEWMPGIPPKQAAPPPMMPPMQTPTAEAPSFSGSEYQPPSYQEPMARAEPSTEAPTSYYVPSDATRPPDYSGAYGQDTFGSSHVPLTGTVPPTESETMPTYVRVPEPEPNAPMGGIPPRPVREASPLAIPGGERAWLPFAFGALVLLLCAVVLFFGVRGLPQFSGANVSASPTQEEATEEPTDILPTETVELQPTEETQPTEAATAEPQPTPEPQVVTAVTTDVLNIRAGPARTTASLGKLQKGQQVTVLGRNGDGTWLQIERPDGAGQGWVSAEFVTLNGDINTLPVTSGENGAQPTETPTG